MSSPRSPETSTDGGDGTKVSPVPARDARSSSTGSTRSGASYGAPARGTMVGTHTATGDLGSSLLNSPFRTPRNGSKPVQYPSASPSHPKPSASAASYLGSGSIENPSSANAETRGVNSPNWRLGAGPHVSDNQQSPSAGRRRTGNAGPIRGSDSAVARNHEPIIQEASSSSAGANIIYVTQQRAWEGGDPKNPQFLSHFSGIDTEDAYYKIVLPFIARCTFVIESTADIHFLHAVLKSGRYPQSEYAVTKVSFPKMYWFSGIQHNRKINPSLAFLACLPCVEEVTLTFHTAGFTTSAYTEKDRLRIEAEDLEKSKQLRVIRLPDLCRHYDLHRLFACKKMKTIHLHCINSEMVSFFSRAGDPLSPFRDLIYWIQQGFHNAHGTTVSVDAQIIDPE